MASQPTSYTKSLDEERLKWFAEKMGLTAQPDFQHAAEHAQEQDNQPGEIVKERGSSMVENDTPVIHNVPPDEWRRETDAKDFSERWSDEQIEAMAERYKQDKIAELKAQRDAAQREQDTPEATNNQQADRGDDYGMER
ncbi:hypothetical protein HY29_16120 [Hyphomonas beringensis]|uniref:Uncharacterized protein n=1 Tax=Hyphomonas beringensis TaxID=1280946 RepID=A0A062UAX3_9PROT|nr:hypothetical protein [Hyphomonas beringensis]KCZ53734.1 hypothetical protein HY29_16120 [Hyphomonas beringensis]